MKSKSKIFQSGRRGATVAGLGGTALAAVLLLCGAGNVPVENFTPQGAMQADLNAGGHSLTNAATVTATNVAVSGTLTATNFTLPYARVTATPTNVAGYGITDAYTKSQADARYDANGAAATAQTSSQPLNTNLTAYAATAMATTAAAVPVAGLTGAGRGVTSALAQGVNSANGATVADANNHLPYDPHAANLNNTTDVFEGDSITYGLNNATGSAFANNIATDFAALNYASGHSTVVDVGIAGAQIPAGSNGGNNITDHYAANVYPHRPWANQPSAATGTGTITGDGNVTLTGSGTSFTTQLAVGGTIYFGGHLARIATITSNTQLTLSTTAPSPIINSLAGINPLGATFVYGGDGGPRANLHLMIGTNDLSGGVYTAAQIVTNLTTYTTQARTNGFFVILSTILPAGRDGSIPNDTRETTRETVNSSIRRNLIPCDMVADSAVILSNFADTNFYQSDQLHPTAAGDAVLAAFYNAGMTALQFPTRPTEGSFETPVSASSFSPNYFGNSQSELSSPIYYIWGNTPGSSIGIGSNSGYETEFYSAGSVGWEWDENGYQATPHTTNQLMYLDSSGNLTIAGNYKGQTVQVNSVPATLAVNSRTCFFSGVSETLTLPATCAQGDTVTVVGCGVLPGLFTIAKATGQSIYMGSGTAYSSIAAQASGDSIQLVCTQANTSWTASSIVGTFTETP